MFSLKKWLGLKLWLAVWLLVLLVPTWREDAREQWSGKNWNSSSNPYHSYKRGLTTKKIEAIAARAPDDVAAQLELLGGRFAYNSGESLPKNAARQKQFFDDYAALSRRFPRENAIRQAWLLDLTRGGLRIEPDSFYANLPAKDKATPQQNWVSEAQLRNALNAARKGARIEPQNSFFPWMECALSFALKRPADAMKAIERASECTTFNDGTLQTARRRIALLGRVQSVSWSDKEQVMNSLLLPHFSRLTSVSRAVMEVSRQSNARGDKVRALQTAATLARAGAAISRSKNLIITVLVGDAIQKTAWNSALKNVGREVETPTFGDEDSFFGKRENLAAREAHNTKLAREVALYARELQQEAIARQALSSDWKGSRLGADYGDSRFDNGSKRLEWLSQLLWIQARLLRLSLVGALFWILSLCFTFKTASAADFRRAMIIWAAFCVGATATLLGVGAFSLGLGLRPDFSSYESEKILVWQGAQQNFVLALTAIWIFPLVLTLLLKGVKRPQWTLEKRGFSARRVFQILIYAALLGSLATSLAVKYQLSPFLDYIWPVQGVVLLVALLAAGAFHTATTSGKRRLAALLFWCVPIILLAASTLLHPVFEVNYVVTLWGVALFFLICSARLAGWGNAARLRQWFFDLMGRTHVLAATLAVASALAYFGVKVAALPAEAKTGAMIDSQLKIGQVAWLENELKS